MRIKPDNISVDNIELVIEVSDFKFKKYLNPLMKMLQNHVSVDYWESFKYNNYRHNWIVSTDGGKFTIHYKGNMENISKRFRIQFNPNKVDKENQLLKQVINRMSYLTIEIRRVDIAFDYLGITTSELVINPGRKQYFGVQNYPGSDVTYYIGAKGKHGQIKVYDKASEENKELENEEIEYNKTRYEVTIDVKEFINNIDRWKCDVTLPELHLKTGYELGKDAKIVDKMILDSIINGSYTWKHLDYRRRNKLKEMIKRNTITYTKVEPTQSEVEKVLKTFINSYFDIDYLINNSIV